MVLPWLKKNTGVVLLVDLIAVGILDEFLAASVCSLRWCERVQEASVKKSRWQCSTIYTTLDAEYPRVQSLHASHLSGGQL